jgi:HEPN domain-containing protein
MDEFSMRAATKEWIEKAERDFISAQREYRARKTPNYDAACFFSQQCVEKYLKGYLQEHAMPIRKTHDLVQLLEMLPSELGLACMRQEMSILSAYATEFRYPGESASKETAKEAISFCKSLRVQARNLLDLDV